MSKTQKNVPKLRFPGFRESWKEEKLDKLVEFSKGKGYSKSDLKSVGTPIILYGRLYTKYETVISDVDTFADCNPDSIISSGGEVIVPASGETAEDISIASVVKDAGVILGGDLNIITPMNEIDSVFLALSISNGKPHYDMAKMAQGKSVVHLHNSDLSKIQLVYPVKEEQRQIGAFFSGFVTLITLQQHKLDQIKEYKKGMLQKMFPKEGETVPEVRFPGFSGEWVQKKLGEITSKIGSGKTPSGGRSAYCDSGIPLIRSQNVNGDKVDLSDVVFIDKQTDESMENSRVFTNDVLLNITGASIGRSAVYKSESCANVNQHVCIIRPYEGYSSDFIQLHLSSENGQKQIDVNQAGGGREGLNFQQISLMQFAFPSSEEQKFITDCFIGINTLITLQQRKLEAMKEYKKGLLQQMFV